MSWLGIFKRKPRTLGGVPGVSFETGTPAPGNIGYTAKEVAKAGVDDVEVQCLVQVITAKAYIAAQEGHTGIGYRYGNANLLKRAGEQLRGMGYAVRFDPGGETYDGDYFFSPNLSISW